MDASSSTPDIMASAWAIVDRREARPSGLILERGCSPGMPDPLGSLSMVMVVSKGALVELPLVIKCCDVCFMTT
jgi:hypothetical protein